nr:sugar transporter stl1 [Quercus suber]
MVLFSRVRWPSHHPNNTTVGLLTLPSFYNQFPSIDTTTNAGNSTLQGTTVALYEVGAAIGAVSCYWIGDIFGRKRPTLAAAVIVLIGVLLQATSFQLAQLIVARIITGIGVGIFTSTLPSWVGESTEADHRGWLIMLEGSGAIFGLMFVSWLEFGFYFVPGQNQVSWRFPIAFQAVVPIAVLCLTPFLTESYAPRLSLKQKAFANTISRPRWLFAKDRLEEGKAVLARLEDDAEDSEAVQSRAQIIIDVRTQVPQYCGQMLTYADPVYSRRPKGTQR